MDFLYTVIGTPLGWVMWLCYQITKNYGISLLIFTLITRLLMFPITLKQQKSTAKMTMIRPQMDQIQKKYANNKEKLNEELMKLYQSEGYNPMSGCLPLLIQMPILFGLIDVIYRPLKHILRLPAEIIDAAENIALEMGLVQTLSGLNPAQLRVIQSVKEGASQWLALGQETLDKINSLNLNFLGINLGLTPSYDMFGKIFSEGFNLLLLVPILSGVSALATSLISMRQTAATTGDNPAGGAGMKGMMLMMPVFSFIIAFNVPAGVGLYWFYSNIVGLLQNMIVHKIYNPVEIAEKAKKEFEEKQEKERLERIEAKKNAKKANKNGKEMDEKALTAKEINRRKLAEARRRDAERYGEEYVEVTDEDLR